MAHLWSQLILTCTHGMLEPSPWPLRQVWRLTDAGTKWPQRKKKGGPERTIPDHMVWYIYLIFCHKYQPNVYSKCTRHGSYLFSQKATNNSGFWSLDCQHSVFRRYSFNERSCNVRDAASSNWDMLRKPRLSKTDQTPYARGDYRANFSSLTGNGQHSHVHIPTHRWFPVRHYLPK